MKKNCCIIPFYNEAKRIDLNKFKEAFSTSYITFCLVDDGSTDNTLQQLLDFEKQYSNVKVIANKKTLVRQKLFAMRCFNLMEKIVLNI